MLSQPAFHLSFTAALFLMALAGPSLHVKDPAAPSADEQTLRELNDGYIQAFLYADVNWYREHLADDFLCILGDGAIIDKKLFLIDTLHGPGVTNFHLDGLQIRIYGDSALVQAVSVFQRKDGTTGRTRYTDVYIKRDGVWKCVSAQLTRLASGS